MWLKKEEKGDNVANTYRFYRPRDSHGMKYLYEAGCVQRLNSW